MPYTDPDASPDGAQEEVEVELELEVGQSVDAVTGEIKVYHELWEMLKVGSVGGRRVCVVLRTVGREGEVRGCVVRVGEWCQGLFRRGGVDGGREEVVAERWAWEEGRGWEMTFGTGGRGVLACEVAMGFEDDKVEEGRVVDVGDLKWKVEEVTVW